MTAGAGYYAGGWWINTVMEDPFVTRSFSCCCYIQYRDNSMDNNDMDRSIRFCSMNTIDMVRNPRLPAAVNTNYSVDLPLAVGRNSLCLWRIPAWRSLADPRRSNMFVLNDITMQVVAVSFIISCWNSHETALNSSMTTYSQQLAGEDDRQQIAPCVTWPFVYGGGFSLWINSLLANDIQAFISEAPSIVLPLSTARL